MTRTLNNTQIFRAAFVVLLGFLGSGILGFVRTGAYNATFGTSPEVEAFYAAQRIPELLFVVVAGGALGSAFIPVFSRYLKPELQDHAWKLASTVMTLSFASAGLLALVIALLAPVIVPTILTPGWDSAQQALTIDLTRILLITTVIFTVSGLCMGILNAHQSFIFPALAAIMYNIGQIFGAVVIARVLTPYSLSGEASSVNVYGLAYGAIIGAGLHLLIQVPALFKIRARLRLMFNWRLEGVREVLTLMLPRVLGLSIVQINFVVNVAFASTMVTGSQTALTVSWFLMFFVLGVIAQSVGTAIFPTLSALAADQDMVNYKARLVTAMRSVLFLAFPATVGLIVLSEPLVSIYERGDWTRDATQATAWALSFFALGITGHSLLEVLSRAFYALSDTWTPVKVGIVAILANIGLSVVFIQFVGEPDSLIRGPFAGLALANSLTTLIEALVLWGLLNRRIGDIGTGDVLHTVSRSIIASMGMLIALMGVLMMTETLPQLVILFVGAGAGVVVYFLFAILLRMNEVGIITRRFKR